MYKDEMKFEFDPPMQDDLLRLMVRDASLAEAAGHWVQPNYFAGKDREWLAKSVLDFAETFGMPPNSSEVRQMLRVSVAAKDITESEANQVNDLLHDVFEKPLSGSKEYTIEQVKQFAQDRAWERAIVEALPLKKEGRFEEMRLLMDQAANATFDLDTGVYWLFESAAERVNRRLTMEDDEVVPMGIMELDELLRRKGFGPGESICWIGPKGGGKSIALGHVARRAVYDRRKTILFSMEMREDQIADRQDAGFTGVDMWLMREEHERVTEHLRILGKKFPRHFAIKRYPTGAASINDMRRCLKNLKKSHDWEAQFIVLDYMGLVKPRRQHSKRYEEYRELSEDFRGLLSELEVPGHTAAQLTRSGAKAETADGTDVAGMWDALATFDYIYVINQNSEERRNNQIRIMIDKARDGKDKIEVGPLQTAWNRMQFVVRPRQYRWDRMKELNIVSTEK